MELQLVKKADFGMVECDFFKNEGSEYYLTRKQIGQALNYSNPARAIAKIHQRNKERLEKFSIIAKISATNGKQHDTYLYNKKGVEKICRWSRQPKADAFSDWMRDRINEISGENLPTSNEFVLNELKNANEMMLTLINTITNLSGNVTALEKDVTNLENRNRLFHCEPEYKKSDFRRNNIKEIFKKIFQHCKLFG